MRIRWDVRTFGLVAAFAAVAAPAGAQRTMDLRQEAYRLYNAGMFREAIPLLDRVLERKSRDIESHLKRGNSYLRLNRPEQAVADFHAIIRFNPFYADIYVNRGVAGIMLGRLDDADLDFHRAIQLYLASPMTYDPAVTGYFDTSWNWASGQTPINWDPFGIQRSLAHGGLGQVYHRKARDDLALREYSVAIGLYPRDPNYFVGRADVFATLGQLPKALADYDMALRLVPNHSRALAGRGDVLSRLGQSERAMADFAKSTALDPSNIRAYRSRAAALSRDDRQDKALSELDTALRIHPNDPGTLKDRGGVLVRMGHYGRAIAELDEAIRLDPTRAGAYVNRGAAYNTLRRHERALEDFDQAIKLDPANVAAHTNSGLAYYALGRYDQALVSLAEAVRLDPNAVVPLFNRAEVFARLGRSDEAIRDYEAVVRLAPRFAAAHNGLGNALNAAGQHDRAIEEYGKAITLAPSDAAAYRNRGTARRAQGDWDGAIADLTSALTLDPSNADVLRGRGWLRLIAAKPGADEDARSALALGGGDAESIAYLAILGTLASRRAGRDREADAFLADSLGQISPAAWPAPVLRYLRHLITAEELLSAADSPAKATEARVFVGINLLAAGHTSMALDHLRTARASGAGSPVVLDLARETLRRLGSQ